MSIADKLTTIAENEQKVYDSGYKSFWYEYQRRGEWIYGAQRMFSGVMWNDRTFYPQIDIHLMGDSSYTFANNNVTNLRERLAEQDVKIILHDVNTMSYFFNAAITKEIPTIDMTGTKNVQRFVRDCPNLVTIPSMNFSTCTNFDYFAYNCPSLKTVELINFSSATTINYAFGECSKLENIAVEGIIPVSISFSSSPLLTHESLTSIINALQDITGTTTTRTLTLGATNLAKLTDEEKVIATQKGWTLA